ncbi:MAG: desulfoferrodoxin Dfx [Erysipelotrichaceae bacterium]|nr:desulfoferrodoxin Dfx [Erysipelotrichaceae bacterium]
MKFYKCAHCGFVAAVASDGVGAPVCCGGPMDELTANTTDAATEKHVPVVTLNGDIITVNVGSVAHPMTAEHHIAWIYVQTEKGGQFKNLAVDGAPEATFAQLGDKVVAVYEYCNLHGLWKADL